jgi:acetyl esterase/lipase
MPSSSRSPSPAARRAAAPVAVATAAALNLFHEITAAALTVALLSLILVVAPFVANGEEAVCRRVPSQLQHFLRDRVATWLVKNAFTTVLTIISLLLTGHLRALLSHLCSRPSQYRYSSARNSVLDFFPATSDALLPAGAAGRPPLVIFVHGGTWSYSSRRLHRLVGVRLAKCGFSVAVLGYDRWPLADAAQQAAQVGQAVDWLLQDDHPQRAELEFDRQRAVIFGHSSGGHIAMLWLLNEMVKPSVGDALSSGCLAAFVTLGAPVDIQDVERHERGRGVADISALGSACGPAVGGFGSVSTNKLARKLATPQGMRRLWRLGETQSALRPPRLCFLHGTADKSIPCSAVAKLGRSLAALNLNTLRLIDLKRDIKLIPGGGHSTDMVSLMLGADCETVRTLVQLAAGSQ